MEKTLDTTGELIADTIWWRKQNQFIIIIYYPDRTYLFPDRSNVAPTFSWSLVPIVFPDPAYVAPNYFLIAPIRFPDRNFFVS